LTGALFVSSFELISRRFKMFWKKKGEKTEEKKEESLLKGICGDDAKLYDILSKYLYENPLVAISEKDLDILIDEAEKSGNFGPAMDKAIFEAAQNTGERERYIKVIQDLVSKTIHVTEQEKEKAEKENLIDQAAFLERRIENLSCLSERTEDIINAASEFYNEKLVEAEEEEGREAREEKKRDAEWEEKRTVEQEKVGRTTRKKERRGMGREEKREAEKQDKREELAVEERKELREKERKEAEMEEIRIEELEKTEREARKQKRLRD
jgi:hypothetical protein